MRPWPGRFTIVPQTKRWMPAAAGIVGVGIVWVLMLALWSSSVAPSVPAVLPILATLALPEPVDFAAAESGARQSYAIRTVAFETFPPADATAAMLLELSAAAAVTPPEGDGSSYVVWIRPYVSLADARLMETVVKRRFGFLDARIVAGALPTDGAP